MVVAVLDGIQRRIGIPAVLYKLMEALGGIGIPRMNEASVYWL